MTNEDKIDYQTAKFVLDAIRDALEAGGSVNWARLGKYQNICNTELTKKEKSS